MWLSLFYFYYLIKQNGSELMNSYYSNEELDLLQCKKASIYSAQKISIGNNVRIDDFVILSGRILIGNYVHIQEYLQVI